MSPRSQHSRLELQVAVLGPLEVLVDGCPVGPAGPTRRGLLALLALEAGRVVAVESLVDRLWGEHPPASATHLVQTYVSTWRSVLGGRGGPLRTSGAGYCLDLDDQHSDLGRFRALVREARQLELPEAERALDAGLSLWRGPALADLVGEPFHARVTGPIEAERARAIESWAETALRIGKDPTAVLPRLADLTAAEPMRESAAALTMWAQAAAGSPSEALRTYDDVLRLLRDELGADPSPLLREMHGRVLRADPSLAPAHPVVEHVATGGDRADPLFGRDQELVTVRELLEERKLVTLTGPGGAGKTRLAAEVLRRYAETEAAAWFVDLSPVRDDALIASAVAACVGAQAAAGTDPETALIARLSAVKGVMVLDNAEHLPQVARLVSRLRMTCPALRLLLTSRRGLNIAGERQFPVPLLAVPHPEALVEEGKRALERVDGVRLLVDRATAADPTFRITDDNAGEVAALVRHLDGLPLAIEITAPWLRMFSPAVLLDRVSKAGLDLAGQRTDLPERHRTLRDTIGWSYDLLTPVEQAVFRRLAVFVGSFSVESAETVCADEHVPPGSVADHLLTLVDRNLVRPAGSIRDQRRFRLLETVREFAGEQLEDDPQRVAVRERHVSEVSAWAARLAARSEGPDSGYWLASTVAEAENIRSALQRLSKGHRSEELLQLAVDAMVLWFEAGHEHEGEQRLSEALEAAGPTAPARAIGLTYLAWLQSTRDRLRATTAALEALALARATDDPLVEAFAQQTLGDTLDDQDAALSASHAVFEAAERAEGLTVRYGPTAPAAVRCGASASIAAAWAHRSVAQALTWQRDALRLAEVEGDRRIIGVNAARLAHLHLLGGDTAEAEILTDRARTLVSTEVTARWEDIVALAEAELAFHLGHRDEAERRLQQLVDRALGGGRPLHARLGSLLLADLLTHADRADAAWDALDRLASVAGGLVDPTTSAAVTVRRARLDRLASREDEAKARLDTAEAALSTEQLSPERVVLLVERALLAGTAAARDAQLKALANAQARTGIQLPPWEAAFVSSVRTPTSR